MEQLSKMSMDELISELNKQESIYIYEKDIIIGNEANWQMTLLINEINKRNNKI